jgi:hypothetical protein
LISLLVANAIIKVKTKRTQVNVHNIVKVEPQYKLNAKVMVLIRQNQALFLMEESVVHLTVEVAAAAVVVVRVVALVVVIVIVVGVGAEVQLVLVVRKAKSLKQKKKKTKINLKTYVAWK